MSNLSDTRMKTNDELSTASAQRRLQEETRSFSNAMAKTALQKATASFKADKAAAELPSVKVEHEK